MTAPGGPTRAGFDLSRFTGRGYDKGRPFAVQVLWMIVSRSFSMRWWCPNSVRVRILRAFGAEIADGVLIHWPWKLTVGESSWIGEDVWILNLEPVVIGSNTCISQDVLLCTGSHDQRSPTFEFDNAPITIGDSVWIAARATVLRGVSIGSEATVGATALVHRDVPAGATVLAARMQLRGD